MREIKFRAWDKKAKKMYFNVQDAYDGLHCHEVPHEGSCNHDDFTASSFGGVLEDSDWYEVMQFTGLKDKNGKEIYEGDVVKYREVIVSETDEIKQLQGADYVKLNFIGTIVWDDEGCSFDIDGGENGYRGFNARGMDITVEVIGNIYETPELTKEKSDILSA